MGGVDRAPVVFRRLRLHPRCPRDPAQVQDLVEGRGGLQPDGPEPWRELLRPRRLYRLPRPHRRRPRCDHFHLLQEEPGPGHVRHAGHLRAAVSVQCARVCSAATNSQHAHRGKHTTRGTAHTDTTHTDTTLAGVRGTACGGDSEHSPLPGRGRSGRKTGHTHTLLSMMIAVVVSYRIHTHLKITSAIFSL